MRRALKTGTLAVSAFVVSGLLAGAVYERIAEHSDAAKFPKPGRLVDAGGHRLYLHCSGHGYPVVVLDTALGIVSYSWERIQAELAGFTTVCSYDRAGYGLSEPGPKPRTSEQIASEMYALLRNAGVPGPYVLVGHSLGGYNIRMFTKAHPGDVAGLVFVDAASEEAEAHLPPELRPMMMPNLSQMRLARFLAEFGIHRVVLTFRRHPGHPAAALNLRRRAFLDAAYSEMEALPQSTAQVKNAGSLGDRPVIVLTRGPVRAGEAPRKMPERQYVEFERIWRDELQPAMVRLSTRGKQRFAEHSGHMIPQEEPEAVVAAVRDVVGQLRRDGPPSR